jgi:hypothetical protein
MAFPRTIAAFILSALFMGSLATAGEPNQAQEPKTDTPESISLFDGKSFEQWDVPSDNWSIQEGCIVGDISDKSLDAPEWLLSKQTFSDFVFSCEIKLLGDEERNTGIYYRINTFTFRGHDDEKEEGDPEEEEEEFEPYTAVSGYEMDAFDNRDPEDPANFWGSLGDWYKRPDLRLLPDQDLLKANYKPEAWNRLTLRAKGNRLEHWVNGAKVVDYTDLDPEASREGMIGLQLHDGSKMKVLYRNIRLVPLK